MSIIDVAEDVVMWLGRAARVLPAFQGLWQTVEGDRQEQIFAAQLEMVRAGATMLSGTNPSERRTASARNPMMNHGTNRVS